MSFSSALATAASRQFASQEWKRQFGRPLVAIALAVGLGTLSYAPWVKALDSTPPTTVASVSPSEAAESLTKQVFPEEGVYLYGQTTQPDEIGAAYLVFEVKPDGVVGAFYMPHSSFDCFYGQVEPERLALTVVSAYDREEYPYAVAVEEVGSVASTGSLEAEMGLEGFHRLESVSDNDQRILGVCQSEYGDRI